MVFGTSTGIIGLDEIGLEMGRVRLEFGPGVVGDGIQGDDGLIDLIIEFPISISTDNPLFDWLLVDDILVDLPGKMRFTDDGRMLILVWGSDAFFIRIPFLVDIPLPAVLSMHMLSPPAHRPW